MNIRLILNIAQIVVSILLIAAVLMQQRGTGSPPPSAAKEIFTAPSAALKRPSLS